MANLGETALALKLSGSELCRHVNLGMKYVEHVWKVADLARKIEAGKAKPQDYTLLKGYGISPECTY